MQHPSLTVVNHSLLHHKLRMMRDRFCELGAFRRLMREVGLMLCLEATRDLPVISASVETMMKTSEGYARSEGWLVDESRLVAVPILRAGLPFADAFLELVPEARVGHFGLLRQVPGEEPTLYLTSVPHAPTAEFFVLDPMIATGRTILAAVKILTDLGIAPHRIRVVSLIVSSQGVQRFYEHPDHGRIRMFTAAVDPELDAKDYILPGLGDAGDRLFDTDKVRL